MNVQQQISYGMETDYGCLPGETAFGTGCFNVKQADFDPIKPVHGNDVPTKLADTLQHDQCQDNQGNEVTKVPRVSLKGSDNVLILKEERGFSYAHDIDLKRDKKRKKSSDEVNQSSSPPLPRKKPFKPTDQTQISNQESRLPQKSPLCQLQEILPQWNEGSYCGNETNQAFSFDEQLTEEDIRWVSTCELANDKKVQRITFKDMKLVTKTETERVSCNEILIPLQYKEHKNIVKIVGVFICPSYVCIVMEDAGPSLFELKCRKDPVFKKYCEECMADLYEDLCRLVVFLDAHGISHNDIKPENICARQEESAFKLVLIDFESAHRTQDDPEFKPRYTPEYIPPALLPVTKQIVEKVSESNVLPTSWSGRSFFMNKVDFWAISMTACYLMFEYHPYFMTSACDWKCRLDMKSIPTRTKYLNQISENVNDRWVDSQLLPMVLRHYKDSDFIRCLRANLTVDRNKWSIEPTWQFLNGGIRSLCRSLSKIKTLTLQDLNLRAPNSGQRPAEQPRGQRVCPSTHEEKLPSNAFTVTNVVSRSQAGLPVFKQTGFCQARLMPPLLHGSQVCGQVFHNEAVPVNHVQGNVYGTSQLIPVLKTNGQAGTTQGQYHVSQTAQVTQPGYGLPANGKVRVRRMAKQPVPESQLNEVVLLNQASPSAQGQMNLIRIIRVERPMPELQTNVPVQVGFAASGQNISQVLRMEERGLTMGRVIDSQAGPSAQSSNVTSQGTWRPQPVPEVQPGGWVFHGQAGSANQQ